MAIHRMFKRFMVITIATFALFSTNVFASAINGLTKSDFVDVANEYGINPKLLYSIAVVESSMTKGNNAKPWPYTINKKGKPYYLDSKQEAEKKLTQLISSTDKKHIDVGAMQVNLGWHGSRVDEPADLFNPKTNLRVGAEILKNALDSSPNNLKLGIGRYHSWDKGRAIGYANKVMSVMKTVAL
ncbi:lytic transglycosylase domain-containing protein [Plesiomonas shigelloides]|uniref:lytic transglycosylase domain-containing protein n=1 Tax=Plesiomonas shigelloides TaxID=703 RepID=UPI003EB8E460